MKNSIVEKYALRKKRSIIWFTSGWSIWYGSFIIKDFIRDPYLLGAIVLLGLLGGVLFAKNLLGMFRLKKQIAAQKGLEEVLNDEMVQYNRLMAFRTSYLITLALIGIMNLIAVFMSSGNVITLQILLFTAVLSGLISFIFYDK